jgi:hypothetical protein
MIGAFVDDIIIRQCRYHSAFSNNVQVITEIQCVHSKMKHDFSIQLIVYITTSNV